MNDNNINSNRHDQFWLNDLSILWNKDRLIEFFPSKYQNQNERLNSLSRLFIYISILLTVFKSDFKYSLISIIGLLFILLWYKYDTEKKENFDENNILCKQPTLNNPFMNPLYGDPMDQPQACNYDSADINNKASSYFQLSNQFEDTSLFGMKSQERSFYTIPCTDVVNGINQFRDYVYKRGDTCKQNNSECNVYTDVRQNANFFPLQ
jgi:hypothetical protein